eukprot:gene47270-biopygen5392
MDSKQNIFLSELNGYVIRKVSATTSIITTIAGSTSATVYAESSNGGPATSAAIYHPYQLYVDNSESVIYVALEDVGNVRAIDLTTGIITLFAGSQTGTLNEGPATSILLTGPDGIWKDPWGNFFVSDYVGNRLKKIDSNGMATLVAGTGSVATAGATAKNGDGGPPTSATFSPVMIFVDTIGYVYAADLGAQKVRKVFDYLPSASPTPLPSVVPSIVPTATPSA